MSRFPRKRLSVKKQRTARIRFHGYTRDRCKTDQGPLAVRTDRPWISRYSMTDEHIVHAYPDYSWSWHRNSASKRKRNRPHARLLCFSRISKVTTASRLDSSPRLDTCRSRLRTFSLFIVTRGKICSLYSEQGMLPGILMADLNVKHGGAGSLCTVIFGRLLKFPPVVLAWRIDFRVGVCSFR